MRPGRPTSPMEAQSVESSPGHALHIFRISSSDAADDAQAKCTAGHIKFPVELQNHRYLRSPPGDEDDQVELHMKSGEHTPNRVVASPASSRLGSVTPSSPATPRGCDSERFGSASRGVHDPLEPPDASTKAPSENGVAKLKRGCTYSSPALNEEHALPWQLSMQPSPKSLTQMAVFNATGSSQSPLSHCQPSRVQYNSLFELQPSPRSSTRGASSSGFGGKNDAGESRHPLLPCWRINAALDGADNGSGDEVSEPVSSPLEAFGAVFPCGRGMSPRRRCSALKQPDPDLLLRLSIPGLGNGDSDVIGNPLFRSADCSEQSSSSGEVSPNVLSAGKHVEPAWGYRLQQPRALTTPATSTVLVDGLREGESPRNTFPRALPPAQEPTTPPCSVWSCGSWNIHWEEMASPAPADEEAVVGVKRSPLLPATSSSGSSSIPSPGLSSPEWHAEYSRADSSALRRQGYQMAGSSGQCCLPLVRQASVACCGSEGAISLCAGEEAGGHLTEGLGGASAELTGSDVAMEVQAQAAVGVEVEVMEACADQQAAYTVPSQQRISCVVPAQSPSANHSCGSESVAETQGLPTYASIGESTLTGSCTSTDINTELEGLSGSWTQVVKVPTETVMVGPSITLLLESGSQQMELGASAGSLIETTDVLASGSKESDAVAEQPGAYLAVPGLLEPTAVMDGRMVQAEAHLEEPGADVGDPGAEAGVLREPGAVSSQVVTAEVKEESLEGEAIAVLDRQALAPERQEREPAAATTKASAMQPEVVTEVSLRPASLGLIAGLRQAETGTVVRATDACSDTTAGNLGPESGTVREGVEGLGAHVEAPDSEGHGNEGLGRWLSVSERDVVCIMEPAPSCSSAASAPEQPTTPVGADDPARSVVKQPTAEEQKRGEEGTETVDPAEHKAPPAAVEAPSSARSSGDPSQRMVLLADELEAVEAMICRSRFEDFGLIEIPTQLHQSECCEVLTEDVGEAAAITLSGWMVAAAALLHGSRVVESTRDSSSYIPFASPQKSAATPVATNPATKGNPTPAGVQSDMAAEASPESSSSSSLLVEPGDPYTYVGMQEGFHWVSRSPALSTVPEEDEHDLSPGTVAYIRVGSSHHQLWEHQGDWQTRPCTGASDEVSDAMCSSHHHQQEEEEEEEEEAPSSPTAVQPLVEDFEERRSEKQQEEAEDLMSPRLDADGREVKLAPAWQRYLPSVLGMVIPTSLVVTGLMCLEQDISWTSGLFQRAAGTEATLQAPVLHPSLYPNASTPAPWLLQRTGTASRCGGSLGGSVTRLGAADGGREQVGPPCECCDAGGPTVVETLLAHPQYVGTVVPEWMVRDAEHVREELETWMAEDMEGGEAVAAIGQSVLSDTDNTTAEVNAEVLGVGAVEVYAEDELNAEHLLVAVEGDASEAGVSDEGKVMEPAVAEAVVDESAAATVTEVVVDISAAATVTEALLDASAATMVTETVVDAGGYPSSPNTVSEQPTTLHTDPPLALADVAASVSSSLGSRDLVREAVHAMQYTWGALQSPGITVRWAGMSLCATALATMSALLRRRAYRHARPQQAGADHAGATTAAGERYGGLYDNDDYDGGADGSYPAYDMYEPDPDASPLWAVYGGVGPLVGGVQAHGVDIGDGNEDQDLSLDAYQC